MDILAELKKAEQDVKDLEGELQRIVEDHARTVQMHAEALVVRNFLSKHVNADPPAPKAATQPQEEPLVAEAPLVS